MPKPITEQQAEVEAQATDVQDETVPVRRPKQAKKAPAKKPATKAPAAKAKKANPRAENTSKVGEGNLPDDGLTPGERRIHFVKVLRGMGATKATKAVSFAALAEKAGYSYKVTRGVFCGRSGKAGAIPSCLLATGHAELADIDGQGRCVYLTASGAKTKFQEYPFIKVAKE